VVIRIWPRGAIHFYATKVMSKRFSKNVFLFGEHFDA